MSTITRGLGYDKPHELCTLLADQFGKDARALDILHELQKSGIVAGSSVASLLIIHPDFIHKVGDIDLFVDNKEAFNRALDILSCDDAEHRVFSHEVENSGQDLGLKCVSVVSVGHPSFLVPIQIVMHRDDSPMDLIAHFDMDYIQCALHNGQVYTTEAFDNVRRSKQSTRFNISHPPRAYRLSKTLDKGFSVPLYGMYNANGSPFGMTRVTQTEAQSAQKKYLSTYWEEQPDYVRSTEMVRYDQLIVDRWVSVGARALPGPRSKVYYRYGNFVLKDECEREYPVPAICARIVIVAYYEDRHRVQVQVQAQAQAQVQVRVQAQAQTQAKDECSLLEKLGIGKYLRLSKNCKTPQQIDGTDGITGSNVYNAVIEVYLHDGRVYGKIVQLLPCNGAILSPTISPDFRISYLNDVKRVPEPGSDSDSDSD